MKSHPANVPYRESVTRLGPRLPAIIRAKDPVCGPGENHAVAGHHAGHLMVVQCALPRLVLVRLIRPEHHAVASCHQVGLTHASKFTTELTVMIRMRQAGLQPHIGAALLNVALAVCRVRGGDRGGGCAGRGALVDLRHLERAVPDGPPGRFDGPVAPAVVAASAGGSHDRGRDGRNASGQGVHQRRRQALNVTESLPRSDCAGRRLREIWSRYCGANTQNSWPSGSAMTTQLTSPWPMSMRVAPRETRRSISAC